MGDPLVVVIVLNTNRREDTLEALASLGAGTYANQRVIVLDNASNDGSVAAIASAFPRVLVIELTENLGYAGNNNVGIRAAMGQRADWILVLNEDTVLAPDCVEHLVRVGNQDDRIGVVGPIVYHHSEPGVIQSAGGQLGPKWESQHIGQNERDVGQFSEPHDVEWISGCAIMVRRGVIEQVGGLDTGFFYYWEETEWCLRARRAGWRIVHVPSAKLWHKGVSRDYRPGPNVTYYSTRNRFLTLSKHRAPATVWVSAWMGTLRTLLSWTLRRKWVGKRAHRDAMLQGALDFLRGRTGARGV